MQICVRQLLVCSAPTMVTALVMIVMSTIYICRKVNRAVWRMKIKHIKMLAASLDARKGRRANDAILSSWARTTTLQEIKVFLCSEHMFDAVMALISCMVVMASANLVYPLEQCSVYVGSTCQ